MRSLVMDGVHRQIASGVLDLSSKPDQQATPKPVAMAQPIIARVQMDGLVMPCALRQPLTPLASALSLAELALPMPSAGEILTETPTGQRLRWNWAAAATAAVLVPALAVSGVLGLHQLGNMQGAVAKPVAAAASAPAPRLTESSSNAALLAHQAKLQTTLSQFGAAQGAPFGIVVKDLKTGEIASINSDQVFTSASLYKLFVANAIYRGVDQGTIKMDDVVAGEASGQTVAQCLTIMINISDNPCGQSLGQKVGWGKQNTLLSNAGFTHTDLSTPQRTSASDVALLLERLYRGTLISASSTDNFMNLLKSQRVNNRLPQGLPAGTVMAHKTGDLDGFVHDAGVVYGPKTDYLIVSTSGPWANPGVAPDAFKALSAQVFAHFNE